MPNDLYISYNKYSQFKTCPAMISYERSVGRPKQEDLRNAAVGICMHSTAESYLKRKCQLKDLVAVAGKFLRGLELKRAIHWRSKTDPTEVRHQVWTQAQNLKELLELNDITPENSESEFTIKVRHVDGLTMAGRVDIKKKVPNGYKIFDVKATYKPDNVDYDQFGVYFMLAEFSGAHPVGGAYLFTAENRTLEIPVSSINLGALLTNMYSVARKVQEGVLPMLPSHACTYCDYKVQCPGSKQWARIKVTADTPDKGSPLERVSWDGQRKR